MAMLERFRRNVFSQNGEDGVIGEILRRTGTQSGWFCEFGAWDGRYGSNCYCLLKQGWRGIMIEGEPDRFRRLLALQKKFPDTLYTVQEFVDHNAGSEHALDNILVRFPIPPKFDVLSIDIDGLDYLVWQATTRIEPAIVIIEINSSFEPGVEAIAGSGNRPGTSFSSMLALGRSKGYELAVHTGNMIFVRRDVYERLGLPESEKARPETLFCRDWINPTRVARVLRKARYMTPQRAVIKLENFVAEKMWRR